MRAGVGHFRRRGPTQVRYGHGMGGVRAIFERHRKRLARLVLVTAVLLVGLSIWSEVPREAALEIALGETHADVLELRISYLRDGEAYQGVRFDFPAGAPRRVQHTVSLPSGPFDVQLDLVRRGERFQRTVHRLQMPVEGLVRLRPSQ